jgi:LysR family transcriptional regulator, glycine cleavage system transcriptional activator
MSTRHQNISLRGLRTFCVVAEQESFRDAADKLFITASAVSHQIRNLEDELGQRLFDRRSRSIHLTEAGRSLYDDVNPLIGELDGITARHRKSRLRSMLTISVQPFFASELFIPRLPKFTQRHPGIDINVDTSDESAERHPGHADVSIRVFKAPPAALSADRLFALRLVPASSAEFRDKLQVEGSRVLSEFPLIVHETRPGAWKHWERSSGIALPKESNMIRMDSMIAVARAAERGLGAALVPVQLSDGWFSSGNLVRLFPHELTTDDAYYFVCNKNDRDKVNVRKLREWVLQEFDDCA